MGSGAYGWNPSPYPSPYGHGYTQGYTPASNVHKPGLSDEDVERIAEAVVKKLDERHSNPGVMKIGTGSTDSVYLCMKCWHPVDATGHGPDEPCAGESKSSICSRCRMAVDSPGHEFGCDVGREDYGHDH